MPVMKNGEIVGSVTENSVLSYILQNPLNHPEKPVSDIMDAPFPMADFDLPYSKLNLYINKKIPAVIVKDKIGQMHIVTHYDIIQAIG